MPKVIESKFNVDAVSFRTFAKHGTLLPHLNEVCNVLTNACHGVALASGWWHDLHTGEPKDRNMGEMLCLIHSEISEAMEGDRKNEQDKHLPHRKSLEVELADAVIRIFDIAGGLNMDLGGAIAEKLQYNCNRDDHKRENRAAEGGKTY